MDYLSWRRGHRGTKKGGQVGARTLQKDRACLHAVFAFAEELELRDGNPVARVSPPKASGSGSSARAFHNAIERAKLPADLHQHDLRHRRVTTWLADGADVAKVREAMGHADLRTTMGYTHLVRENLRSLVEPVGRSWEDSAGKDAKVRDVAEAFGA